MLRKLSFALSSEGSWDGAQFFRRRRGKAFVGFRGELGDPRRGAASGGEGEVSVPDLETFTESLSAVCSVSVCASRLPRSALARWASSIRLWRRPLKNTLSAFLSRAAVFGQSLALRSVALQFPSCDATPPHPSAHFYGHSQSPARDLRVLLLLRRARPGKEEAVAASSVPSPVGRRRREFALRRRILRLASSASSAFVVSFLKDAPAKPRGGARGTSAAAVLSQTRERRLSLHPRLRPQGQKPLPKSGSDGLPSVACVRAAAVELGI